MEVKWFESAFVGIIAEEEEKNESENIISKFNGFDWVPYLFGAYQFCSHLQFFYSRKSFQGVNQ